MGSTKIIDHEDENWKTNLLVNTMADPNVSPDVGIVACHNYDGSPPSDTPAPMPTFTNPNAATWETEVSILGGSDSTITNALYWAARIHYFMTIAQVNAWHYWWLLPFGDDNEGLLDQNATPTKRLFALGQFSRFVRPNFYRIGATNNGAALISAYKDSLSLAYAIVAINSSTSNNVQTFTLPNFPDASVLTTWITSSNQSLAPLSPIAVTNLSFTYTLPAMSIVTFSGLATNYAPSLVPVLNQTVNAGVTVTLTNVASDILAPPQTLAFNLLNAPAGASFNTSNGVFSWRPPVSSGNTTNLISIQVVNNGTPVMSATNNFNIIVNPVAQPSLSSISVSGQQIKLVAQGTQGPDYTLLTSSNLITWQSVLTTNSPTVPVTFLYTNSGPGNDRFFRLELGP